ncbi:hypothetical protein [Aquimarina hainanensis]
MVAVAAFNTSKAASAILFPLLSSVDSLLLLQNKLLSSFSINAE